MASAKKPTSKQKAKLRDLPKASKGLTDHDAKAVTGGVVVERLGGDHVQKKHIAVVKYE